MQVFRFILSTIQLFIRYVYNEDYQLKYITNSDQTIIIHTQNNQVFNKLLNENDIKAIRINNYSVDDFTRVQDYLVIYKFFFFIPMHVVDKGFKQQTNIIVLDYKGNFLFLFLLKLLNKVVNLKKVLDYTKPINMYDLHKLVENIKIINFKKYKTYKTINDVYNVLRTANIDANRDINNQLLFLFYNKPTNTITQNSHQQTLEYLRIFLDVYFQKNEIVDTIISYYNNKKVSLSVQTFILDEQLPIMYNYFTKIEYDEAIKFFIKIIRIYYNYKFFAVSFVIKIYKNLTIRSILLIILVLMLNAFLFNYLMMLILLLKLVSACISMFL